MRLVVLLALLFSAFLHGGNVTVKQGWQMLGVSGSVDSISDFNRSSVKLVWAFERTTQSWKAFSSEQALSSILISTGVSPLTALDEHSGFWVLGNYQDAFSLKLSSPLHPLEAKHGWQLLGSTNGTSNMDDFNKSGIAIVWAYDDYTQRWAAFSPNPAEQAVIDSEQNINRLNSILPNSGFWVLADSNTTIQPPNQPPVAVIGINGGYGSQDQLEQNITSYVGATVNGLESSYSFDPDGTIVYCSWKDDNGAIVKEQSSNMCNLLNKVFDTSGLFNYTLTVRDNSGATDTNIAHITILANSVPVISNINDNYTIEVNQTLNITPTVIDADGDNISYIWYYSKVGSSTQYGGSSEENFNHKFPTTGNYIVNLIVTDIHGAKAMKDIQINVTSTQSEPTTTLSDINESVISKSIKNLEIYASDINGISFIGVNHGDVNAYLISNEIPALEYTSNDCFIGMDTFYYLNNSGEVGKVNMNIQAPSDLKPVNETKTLFSTDAISGEQLMGYDSNIQVVITTPPTHGIASLTAPNHEIIFYNYTPNNGYVGNDYFIYTMSSTINGCTYTKTGRIDLIVEDDVSLHYLRWWDAEHGYELWKSDGTVSGTAMIKDINPGTASGEPTEYGDKNTINGFHFFTANDSNKTFDRELYKTDGTLAGTTMVKNIGTEPGVGSHPINLTVLGNNIYFFAQTDGEANNNFSGNVGLWKSNGSQSGTILLHSFGVYAGTGYSPPGYLKKFDTNLMFMQDEDSGNGPNWEPWVYNLSSNSVTKLDIWSGIRASGFNCNLELNHKCYSAANDGVHGGELWVSDGTDAGTHMVKDINSGDSHSNSINSNLILNGGKIYFIAWTDTDGYGLYRSDGTQGGTTVVKDMFTGNPDRYNSDKISYRLVTAGGKIFFTLDDEVHGKELWVSDGTDAGTHIIKDIRSGAEGSYPDNFTSLKGKLYFIVYNENNIPEIWVSDGTESGTVAVTKLYNHYYDISGDGIVAAKGLLFIEIMNYSESKRELWRSDGTVVGTFKLKDGKIMNEEGE